MLIKVFFWIMAFVDAAALLLIFVLGLAAAPSSRTSPLAVAAYLLIIPGLLLAAAIVMFLRAKSGIGRAAALLLVAAPMLMIAVTSAMELAKLKLNSNDQGSLTYFHEGPMRDVSAAITKGGAAAVSALLPQVNVNERGYRDMTLLILALRQLRTGTNSTGGLAVLRTLIQAGADPNASADELPLEMAIQMSSKVGSEPALLLLKAGANPNAKTEFGNPVFFAATGRLVNPEILPAVLDHGANLKMVGNQGRGVVHDAAMAANWKAVLVLLKRGADWRQIRSPRGEAFPEMLGSHLRAYGEEPGLVDVMHFVKTASHE